MIMGMIVGGFVAFLFINFIIYKNIREVFNGFRQFGIFIVAASIIITVFSFDIFGIDKYIPAASNVGSVEIDNRYFYTFRYYMYDDDFVNTSGGTRRNDNFSNAVITDTETIELINNIMKTAMKSTVKFTSDHYLHGSPSNILNGAEIKYNLKNGGTVYKKIPWNIGFDDDPDAIEYKMLVDTLFADKNYKKMMYAPITDEKFMADLLSGQTVINSINIYNYTDWDTFYNSGLIASRFPELLSKLNEDILSEDFIMEFNQTHWIEIIVNKRMQDGITETHVFNITLNENFRNTLKFLEEFAE